MTGQAWVYLAGLVIVLYGYRESLAGRYDTTGSTAVVVGMLVTLAGWLMGRD